MSDTYDQREAVHAAQEASRRVNESAPNKGLPVSGYRPQSDEAVAFVNTNKQMEEVMLQRLDRLKDRPDIDQRWLALGRTHIEQGFMAINRAVFQPDRVKLSGDEK